MFPAAFSSPRHHGNVSVDLRGGTPQARMCKSRRFLIALAVPRFSKFANHRGGLSRELRRQRGTGKYILS
jgi:hypothetical protein